MNITLNGEKRDVPGGLTIRGLLEHLNITTEKVAVERNLEIVKKATYGEVMLQEGDSLEVVSFMAGGGFDCGFRIADFGLEPEAGSGAQIKINGYTQGVISL